MNSNYKAHEFRKCVVKARSIIAEKDEHSKTAVSLLAELLYDNNNETANIKINNVTWEKVLSDHLEWIEHYDITEYWFDSVKEILIQKIIIDNL